MTEDDNDYIWKDLLQAVYWFDESLQLFFDDAGWPRVSRTKSLIMLNIAEGYERPNQIAENLGLTRQAVHLAIKELKEEGFLFIEDDPDDKRAKRVFFAESNRRNEMRLQARAALHGIEEALADKVGRRKFDAFRSVLRTDWGSPVTPDAYTS